MQFFENLERSWNLCTDSVQIAALPMCICSIYMRLSQNQWYSIWFLFNPPYSLLISSGILSCGLLSSGLLHYCLLDYYCLDLDSPDNRTTVVWTTAVWTTVVWTTIWTTVAWTTELTFCISGTAFWSDSLIVSDVAALIAILTIQHSTDSELSRKHLVCVKFNLLVITATTITFTPDIADLAKQYNKARLDTPHLHHPVCFSHYKMLLLRVQRWIMRPVWVHVVHHHFVLSFYRVSISLNILLLHSKFWIHLKVKKI